MLSALVRRPGSYRQGGDVAFEFLDCHGFGKCKVEFELIQNRDLGDLMRLQAIRDAVQFELDSFHFYRLARDKAGSPEQRAVLERL